MIAPQYPRSLKEKVGGMVHLGGRPPHPRDLSPWWARPPYGFVGMLALMGVAAALALYPVVRRLTKRLEGLQVGVNWQMGFTVLLLVFAGSVLGGLGTAFGAILGSIIVGLLVQLSTLIIPTELKYVGALVVLILILLVRPQGILGKSERIG